MSSSGRSSARTQISPFRRIFPRFSAHIPPDPRSGPRLAITGGETPGGLMNVRTLALVSAMAVALPMTAAAQSRVPQAGPRIQTQSPAFRTGFDRGLRRAKKTAAATAVSITPASRSTATPTRDITATTATASATVPNSAWDSRTAIARRTAAIRSVRRIRWLQRRHLASRHGRTAAVGQRTRTRPGQR